MNLGRETEQVEFKKSTAEIKEGASSVAAILNKHGEGVLYFGVRPDGEVVGQEVSESTLRKVSQSIGMAIEPPIHPTVESLQDDYGRSFIRVAFAGDEAPYACRGSYRIRVADEDVLMSHSEVRRMAAEAEEGRNPWDERISPRSMDDVDQRVLKAYVERGNACGRISFEYEGVEDALARLGLLRDGVLTNAAEVLFCQSRLPMLKMGVFADHDRIDILDIQQEQGTMFELARKAEFYILSNIRRRVELDGGMERKEVPELPMEAVREAVVNAFAHRSYRSALAVQVEVYPDSVEVISPGWFPHGHTPEAHLAGEDRSSNGPNRLIASALFKSKDIESFATGMPRMRRLCDAAGIKVRYGRDPHGTVVAFERPDAFQGSPPAPASSRQLPPAPASSRQLDANEQVVCDYLSRHPQSGAARISESVGMRRRTLSDVLRRLQDKGVVVAHGAGTSRTYSLADSR